MDRKYLAFDIEIAKELPKDEHDLKAHRPLGMICAATLAATEDQPKIWYSRQEDGNPADRMSRQDAQELVNYLVEMAADDFDIVTWNGLYFDFDILAEESDMLSACRDLALDHVDMMFHLVCALGYPVSLAAGAKGMRLEGKTKGLAGWMVPGLWAKGERRKVLDYVAQDVRTTLELASLCEHNRRFHWITRQGKPRFLTLSDGWLTVQEALQLPKPDTSWMSKPMPRERFTEWG